MSSVLSQKVLVLNRTWTPIAFATVEKAMCLVIATYKTGEPKARIIDAYQDFRVMTWKDWSKLIPGDEESVIRSGAGVHRVPEIILLSRFNKLPKTLTDQQVQFSRRSIYRRDKNTCQYCGSQPGTSELSIDHIFPRSKGGLTTWENCIIACTHCNRCKSNILPKRAGNQITVYFARGKERWQVTIQVPKKPRHSLYTGGQRCKSWESILGAAFWMVELDNDN